MRLRKAVATIAGLVALAPLTACGNNALPRPTIATPPSHPTTTAGTNVLSYLSEVMSDQLGPYKVLYDAHGRKRDVAAGHEMNLVRGPLIASYMQKYCLPHIMEMMGATDLIRQSLSDRSNPLTATFSGYWVTLKKEMTRTCELLKNTELANGASSRVTVRRDGVVQFSMDAIRDILQSSLAKQGLLVRTFTSLARDPSASRQFRKDLEQFEAANWTIADAIGNSPTQRFDRASKSATAAILFIIRHEIAHVELQHHAQLSGKSGSYDICEHRNRIELEADEHAISSIGALLTAELILMKATLDDLDRSPQNVQDGPKLADTRIVFGRLKKRVMENTLAGIDVALDPNNKMHTAVANAPNACRMASAAERAAKARAILTKALERIL